LIPLTTLRVNGATHRVPAAPDTPLLLVLRNDLRLASPKYGCGAEQCGACMVLIDGQPAPTCRLPVRAAAGRAITTVEGLAPGAGLHPIQEAFIAHNAIQCGYCASGVMIAAAALLEREPSPTREQIQTALDRNICRCGAHNRMIRATQQAVAAAVESAP
jgi:nicotinate dehydrogenase subunit A